MVFQRPPFPTSNTVSGYQESHHLLIVVCSALPRVLLGPTFVLAYLFPLSFRKGPVLNFKRANLIIGIRLRCPYHIIILCDHLLPSSSSPLYPHSECTVILIVYRFFSLRPFLEREVLFPFPCLRPTPPHSRL